MKEMEIEATEQTRVAADENVPNEAIVELAQALAEEKLAEAAEEAAAEERLRKNVVDAKKKKKRRQFPYQLNPLLIHRITYTLHPFISEPHFKCWTIQPIWKNSGIRGSRVEKNLWKMLRKHQQLLLKGK